jgi:hypothetical protein
MCSEDTSVQGETKIDKDSGVLTRLLYRYPVGVLGEPKCSELVWHERGAASLGRYMA